MFSFYAIAPSASTEDQQENKEFSNIIADIKWILRHTYTSLKYYKIFIAPFFKLTDTPKRDGIFNCRFTTAQIEHDLIPYFFTNL